MVRVMNIPHYVRRIMFNVNFNTLVGFLLVVDNVVMRTILSSAVRRSPVRYIGIEYRLLIYQHFLKILISIWSFLKILISILIFKNSDKGIIKILIK